MSPIGRTFIVLNLILAGVFTYAAGDLLKNQNNWKEKHATDTAALEKTIEDKDRNIAQLDTELRETGNAKISFEQQYNALKVANDKLADDNKTLNETISSQRVDLKTLASNQESMQTDYRAAFDKAEAAYELAIAAAKAKDDAVREKDTAVAENRQLRNDIAGLNSTIEAKNASINDLNRDNSEKDLLLAAARSNGFIDSMAAPTLAGTVTNAAGSLVTVSVADNPGDVDIQDIINKLPFRFAIYGDGGYKGDAVAQKYEASANAVLCKVVIKADNATIRTGDKATTNP